MQILTRFNEVIAYNANGYIPIGNSAVCIDTNECYSDVLIVTVDGVPSDINRYEYYYINGKFVKGASKTMMAVEQVEIVVPQKERIPYKFEHGCTYWIHVVPTYRPEETHYHYSMIAETCYQVDNKDRQKLYVSSSCSLGALPSQRYGLLEIAGYEDAVYLRFYNFDDDTTYEAPCEAKITITKIQYQKVN